MNMVNVNSNGNDKDNNKTKEDAAVLRTIHKMATRLAKSTSIEEAQMMTGAISLVIGAVKSKKPNWISYAKSVVSKAMSSW